MYIYALTIVKYSQLSSLINKQRQYLYYKVYRIPYKLETSRHTIHKTSVRNLNSDDNIIHTPTSTKNCCEK